MRGMRWRLLKLRKQLNWRVMWATISAWIAVQTQSIAKYWQATSERWDAIAARAYARAFGRPRDGERKPDDGDE